MKDDQLDLFGAPAPIPLFPKAPAPAGAPADDAVRRRIVEDVHRSCLVEASAGTGKTRLLVDRILNIIRSGATLESVVAITFTERAASELRTRIRDGIQEKWRDQDIGQEERARFGEALRTLDRAMISTIHAFCTTLLKARPVEAGVSPGFLMAANVESGLLKNEAWETWKERELANVDSPLRAVLEIGGQLRWLQALGEVMVENRDLMAGPAAKDLLEGPLPGWREAYESYRHMMAPDTFAEIEKLMADCRCDEDKLYAPLRELLPDLRRAADRIFTDEERGPILAIRQPPFTGAWANYGKKEWWNVKSRDRLKQLLKDVNAATSNYVGARKGEAVVVAVRSLMGFLEIYEELKAGRGVLDFQDLLIKTRDLLRDHPDVRADFQSRISHLLVDEFQDTDPLQAEIAFLLAGKDRGSPGDWQDVSIESGRLFLVGDPKQSIYRFRRADIQVYERAREVLEASGGDVHVITVNFRTRPGIAGWVNGVFDRLMPADATESFRPRYSPLESYRPAFGDGPVVERLPLPQTSWTPYPPDRELEKRRNEADRRRVEARALARFVRRRIEDRSWIVGRPGAGGTETQEPAGYGDVALLFRALTGLEIYEDAFREAGVPYRIDGGKYYFQRREVQSLIAILCAIDSPNDREALVAALRSPLLGFDDETILIAAAERPLNYGYHVPPGNPALAEVFGWFRDWHERRHVVGPETIVAEVLDRTKALTFFAMQRQGEQRVANLMKILDESRRYGGEPGAYRAFVDHLAERQATVDEAESQVLEEDEGGYVHFVTVHKAKGLEFPVVIVADLMAGTENQNDMLYDRAGNRIAFRLIGMGEPPPGRSPGWEDLDQLEKQQSSAEETRLFYVAVTRARDRLILPLPERKPTSSSSRSSKPSDRTNFYNMLLPTDWPPDVTGDAPDTATLEIFSFRHPAPKEIVVSAESRELDRIRAEFREKRAALLGSLPMAPRVLTPSGLKMIETESPGAPPVAPDDRFVRPPTESFGSSSRALALGRLVHEVLQRVDLDGASLDAWIDRLLPGHPPLEDADRADVTRLARAALDHPAWTRARSARRVFREAPFFLKHAYLVYVDGTVDLLMEEAAGLTVVDFKTDRVTGKGVDALFAKYRGQALGYALGVTRATGKTVREVIFLFLDAGESRSLNVDEAVLDEAGRLFDTPAPSPV